jgi:hypothetical protein
MGFFVVTWILSKTGDLPAAIVFVVFLFVWCCAIFLWNQTRKLGRHSSRPNGELPTLVRQVVKAKGVIGTVQAKLDSANSTSLNREEAFSLANSAYKDLDEIHKQYQHLVEDSKTEAKPGILARYWPVFVAIAVGMALYVFSDWQPDNPTLDPDNANNKYVRVTRIEPISGINPVEVQGTHAVLIEFGVNEKRTEGLVCEILLNRDFLKSVVWEGAPGRTDKQRSFGMTEYTDVPAMLVGDRVVRSPLISHNATPHTSIYHYFESDGSIEPLDILFFALPDNARRIHSESVPIGRAYSGWTPSVK